MSLQPHQKERIDELSELGLRFNGEYYFIEFSTISSVYVHWHEILYDNEEEWLERVIKIKQHIQRLN